MPYSVIYFHKRYSTLYPKHEGIYDKGTVVKSSGSCSFHGVIAMCESLHVFFNTVNSKSSFIIAILCSPYFNFHFPVSTLDSPFFGCVYFILFISISDSSQTKLLN